MLFPGSINYSCNHQSEAPAPSPPPPTNTSVFDRKHHHHHLHFRILFQYNLNISSTSYFSLSFALFFPTACSWTYCGGGTCVKKSTLGHICDCKEGFSNLLNETGFPCFRDCKNTIIIVIKENNKNYKKKKKRERNGRKILLYCITTLCS